MSDQWDVIIVGAGIGDLTAACKRLAQAAIGHHGNRQVSDTKVFGEMRLATGVREIRVEKGKVLGVTLLDGMRIDSEAVISNADYKNYRSSFAQARAKSLQHTQQPFGIFLCNWGGVAISKFETACRPL